MDPWIHRSANMACRTCMWFVSKPRPELAPLIEAGVGRCRRHAPTMAGYPVVFPSDWCGDHKLDEEKLPRDVPERPRDLDRLVDSQQFVPRAYPPEREDPVPAPHYEKIVPE